MTACLHHASKHRVNPGLRAVAGAEPLADAVGITVGNKHEVLRCWSMPPSEAAFAIGAAQCPDMPLALYSQSTPLLLDIQAESLPRLMHIASGAGNL